MNIHPVTAERARELLAYDPLRGAFTRKVSSGGQPVGAVAGHMAKGRDGQTRRFIRVDGKLYAAARLAFLIMMGRHPTALVDHQNVDATDDRWSNLREATESQNRQNTRRRANNKSGYKGVSFDRFTGRWVTRIRVPGGKYSNLGRFDDPAQGHAAYVSAATDLFGEFARAQ